jgi:hypothetical protein
MKNHYYNPSAQRLRPPCCSIHGGDWGIVLRQLLLVRPLWLCYLSGPMARLLTLTSPEVWIRLSKDSPKRFLTPAVSLRVSALSPYTFFLVNIPTLFLVGHSEKVIYQISKHMENMEKNG